MRILLTNDDGIDAPGLAALTRACDGVASELYVVAPAGETSMVGHRVTTYSPISVESRGPRHFAVEGTPADCVRLAITELLPESPELVLSGINAGGNLGHDIVISGTVAAAREAAYHGYRAAAISHYHRGERSICWDTASRRARRVLEHVLEQEQLSDGAFWNANLPHLDPGSPEPEIVACDPERKPLEVSYRQSEEGYHYTGRYSERPASADSDVGICFGGHIPLSLLRVG